MKSKSFFINNLSDTNQIAAKIAQTIVPNFTVALSGNLGVGKTTLIRAILTALGVKGSIKSPTFTLVEPYQLKNFIVYHFDLYRFHDPEEWFHSGFDEYFSDTQISFIEWAEKADGLIPQIDWHITLLLNIEVRELVIESLTNTGDKCLNKLIAIDVV